MRATVCGLILVAIALVGTVGYMGRKKRDDLKRELAQIQKDYFRAALPPLPGPYLAKAKADELKFKAIPIGRFERAYLSENGKLLLWENQANVKLSNKLFRGHTFRLVDRDNVSRTIDASAVFMSRSGDIYKTRVTQQGPPMYSDLEMPDGKVVEVDKYLYELTDHSFNFVGSQGFLAQDGHGGSVTYLDFSLKPRTFEVPGRRSICFWTQSSILGEIGYTIDSHDDFNKQIAFFKDGKIGIEQVPFQAAFCREKAGGRNLAISVGRTFYERAPYLRTGPGEFVRLGVPRGTVLAEVMAINNRGEFILYADEPCTHTKKHPALPWDIRQYFVSNGKAYDLDEIASSVLPPGAPGAVSHELLDDNGDLVVTGADTGYLLRRIR